MKTPLNKSTLRTHLTYSWWKYLLAAVVIIFGVDLLYTVTKYQSPPEKKVELYVCGYVDNDNLDLYMENVRQNDMPDMEVMDSVMLTSDETYGDMQLSTYMYVGEGDIYVLPKDKFVSYAEGGFFVPLEDRNTLEAYFPEGFASMTSGWRTESDSREKHFYGIPVSKLPGLNQYMYVNDGYLCVLVTNGNDENVLKFLEILCRDFMSQPDDNIEEK